MGASFSPPSLCMRLVTRCKRWPTPKARGYDADLIEAQLRQSGDLETALPSWLRESRLSSKSVGSLTQRAGRIYERNGYPFPSSQELPLLLRKCGTCPSRLGPDRWAGVSGKVQVAVQANFGEDVRVTRIACVVKVKADNWTKSSPDR